MLFGKLNTTNLAAEDVRTSKTFKVDVLTIKSNDAFSKSHNATALQTKMH